jgi:predicted O-methyltransferase YrrM
MEAIKQKAGILQKVLRRIEELKVRREMTRSIRLAVAYARKNIMNFAAENVMDFLFSEDAREIRPWHYREELAFLAREIEARKPKTVVEIGTAAGGTLFLASCLAADNALIVSIDLPDGGFGGGYPAWKAPLYKSFRRKNQRIELIPGNSHEPEVFHQLESILDGRKIDYLFLDGDHTYEGVKQDFDVYSKLLGKNAMVAFHDIISDKSEAPTHFVSVFWNEIKQKYPFGEFVNNVNQSNLGLGVLFVNQTDE